GGREVAEERRVVRSRGPAAEREPPEQQPGEHQERQDLLACGETRDAAGEPARDDRELSGHQICILMTSLNASTALLRKATVSWVASGAWVVAIIRSWALVSVPVAACTDIPSAVDWADWRLSRPWPSRLENDVPLAPALPAAPADDADPAADTPETP